MGLGAIEALAATLQQHGRAGDTPVALVANATRRDQRVLRGCLRDAATLAREGGLRTPVLLIVGEVAAS
jgi:siroheme synthase